MAGRFLVGEEDTVDAKVPKRPGTGKNVPAKPRKTTQAPKRGNKPGS